jgi:hypothetical protein
MMPLLTVFDIHFGYKNKSWNKIFLKFTKKKFFSLFCREINVSVTLKIAENDLNYCDLDRIAREMVKSKHFVVVFAAD